MSKSKGSKRIATYSLIFMAAGFLATTPFQDSVWISLIHGGFEAGLVGGLADWFAVTALFRHPLGIPIPHTALLPNNRQRLTEGLVSVVRNEWLSKESIQNKLKDIPFIDRLVGIINKEIHKESFKTRLIHIVTNAIKNIEIEKITPFIKKQLIFTLSRVDVVPTLQTVRDQFILDKMDQKALDYALAKTEVWLKSKQTEMKLGKISMNAINTMEVSGLRKFAFKSIKTLLTAENLGQMIQGLLLRVLRNLQIEGNPNRLAILAFIHRELEDIENQTNLISTVEKWRDELFEGWVSDDMITDKLGQLKEKLVTIVEHPGFMESKAIPMLEKGLNHLSEKSSEVNNWIQQQIILLVEENHSKIGDLVRENLNKLDNDTLIDLVENNIGKDLQWIRVNGAFCGFVIGILLTGMKLVIG
ncbi:DUF445 domain-containing protein [Niallia sp. XMNu-256]|uniref:DUF445 domain-containing protein n=1 Tax=Niallia sp. XMNu-256 TaxID=3082444 RepID=UPI0030D56D82